MKYHNELEIVFGSNWLYFGTTEITAIDAYKEFKSISERVGINTDNMIPEKIKLRRVSDDVIIDFDIFEDGKWAKGE